MREPVFSNASGAWDGGRSKKAGFPELALKEYGKIDASTKGPRVQKQKAFLMAKTGREREATPLLEELLTVDPKDVYLHSSYNAACGSRERPSPLIPLPGSWGWKGTRWKCLPRTASRMFSSRAGKREWPPRFPLPLFRASPPWRVFHSWIAQPTMASCASPPWRKPSEVEELLPAAVSVCRADRRRVILTTDHGLSLSDGRLSHGGGGPFERAILRATWDPTANSAAPTRR